MAHLRISDGTTWPRPDVADEDELAWRLTYGEPSREDLLQAVSFIRAYGYITCTTTRVKRDLVCRDIRADLARRAEASR